VLLLGRLAGEGLHLLGASHYVRLLLERAVVAPARPTPARRPEAPRGPVSRRQGSGRRRP
jgi:hypothetical protein